MGQPWPCQSGPTPCPCRCHAIAAAHSKRDRAGNWREWQPEHDDLVLARLEDGATLAEIVAALEAAFKIRRSEQAVRHRISALGGSLRTGWRSFREVATLFKVHEQNVAAWRLNGYLNARRRGGSLWFMVTDADLKAFIAAYAGVLFQPGAIRDQSLRRFAETSAQANLIRRTRSS